MSDQDDFETSEATVNQTSTPPLGRRNRSDAEDDFTEETNDGSKRQKSDPSSTMKAERKISSSHLYDNFDQETCENELVEMFVATDLPISFVENKAFQKFLKVLQPKFSVSSLLQTTLANDILTLWDAERTKLQSFLAQHCGRVCLSIDTWTSCQDQNYMCLTAQFIDNHWKLHKKILNFLPTIDCSMEYMVSTIKRCLNDWGLSSVFSLTVDNVSPYDSEFRCLKKMLMSRNALVLKGDYIHMHSCAHILNMIVKEGLHNIDNSFLRISDAVQYIKSSPIYSAFDACAEQEKIERKGYVYLDVETEWNISFEMLEAALYHRYAFEKLELQDKKYVRQLKKGKGKRAPTREDWNFACVILPILEIFRETILHISNISNVTSNIYMLEVFRIGKMISQLCHSNDLSVQLIATKIRKNFVEQFDQHSDRHWERHDALNMLLLIALVFDPRYKVGYINWMINQIFDSVAAAKLKEKLESCLKSLFEEYNGEELKNDSKKAKLDEDGKNDPYSWNEFLQSHKSSFKSELNKYLEEDIETSVELDVLNWWKLNSSRFPVLANIAREVLAMPVSTLTSECAFGTNAKVLDSFCSSLSFELMQALVCTQDWKHGKPFSLLFNEDLQKLKQEMVSQLNVGCSNFVTPDD
ncbi:HAT family dimerization domain-containing protein [Trifolium pratense]|uniref:HAT family dimerization domain-containing protein n=1 Tax=Trifolium pratense TaxID=57577 RepID=A0A2K3NZ93_TRIPR|nr:HAT family dimerization domain-containing protein [Trifolium pratense]